MPHNRNQFGFTLIEVVIVMVITGILAVLVVSFFTPVKGYFAAIARAELADAADTALRRMAVSFMRHCLTACGLAVVISNFCRPLQGGAIARYRIAVRPVQAIYLDFVAADTSFEVIGTLSSSPVAGEELVVYNTAPFCSMQGIM